MEVSNVCCGVRWVAPDNTVNNKAYGELGGKVNV